MYKDSGQPIITQSSDRGGDKHTEKLQLSKILNNFPRENVGSKLVSNTGIPLGDHPPYCTLDQRAKTKQQIIGFKVYTSALLVL